jgi:prepilin-type N-terminal cleavage/methylation domain-containing protein
MSATSSTPSRGSAAGAQAGFTLIESLVAIIVLSFGLMAITNLLLVAATSNTVANQGNLNMGGTPFNATDGGKDCDDPTLVVTDWHCSSSIAGVGIIHTHWYLTAMPDLRILYIRVQSEGVGALAASRSRAEFTTFRSCTNSDPTVGGCPPVP